MQTKNLRQSYSLPVLRKVEEGNNQFYVSPYLGREYKLRLYDFQKSQPQPETILCHVVVLPDGSTMLTQDYSMFLKEFYNVGEIYPFKVVSCHMGSKPGFYKVRDKYGLNFRLIDTGGAKLSEHEDIECVVSKIDGYKLRLKLVSHSQRDLLPFIDIEKIGATIGDPQMARIVVRIMRRNQAFAEAAADYDAARGGWLLKFLDKVHRNFTIEGFRGDHRGRLLKALINISLYLLEGSAYLKELDNAKRRKVRERLESYVKSYSTLTEAIGIVDRQEDESAIEGILVKMRNSGYIYDPGRKLDLMMSIFTLRPEIVEKYMSLILDIITEGNHSNWMQEPFRTAFIRQLDFYVRLTREKADRASNDDSEGRRLLRRMVQALAIRSLMAGKADNSHLQIDRAALYRYLTYENQQIGTKLLERAFLSITDAFEEAPAYDWNDVNDLKKLSLIMSKGSDAAGGAITTQAFEGNTAALRIVGGRINLVPLETRGSLKPLLPTDMLPWHDIQIYGSDKVQLPQKGERRLEALRKFWRDIENSLFRSDDTVAVSAPQKQRPEIGEAVDIVIDETRNSGTLFNCHIVDEHFTGSGTVRIDNIVKYVNSVYSADAFRNAQGESYLLRAIVTRINSDGSMEFNCLPVVKEYLEYSLNFGDTLTCMVLSAVNDFRDRDGHVQKAYIGFSTEGESVICKVEGPDPHYRPGDIINATVEYISNPAYSQVVCRAGGKADYNKPLNRELAFRRFVLNYSEGNVEEKPKETEETQDEEEIQLVTMDEEYVRELIRIIDRISMLENNHVSMFNYLNFCHLLALLVGDGELAEYYSRRFNFLRSVETFVDSGYIDVDRMSVDEEGYMDYPIIRTRAMQMRVLSYFDRPDRNDRLWDIIRDEPNESTRNLAKLALLSNMSMEFNFSDDVRQRVNKEVSQLLKIEVRLPQLVSFGNEESQTLEFKSSFFYDQEFHYNPDGQSDHIVERVCGFLNSAQGGKLYIGVNDFGYASGLDEDMKCLYFKGKGSRDAYDLKVRNDIRNKLGPVANDCITTSWINAGGKDVYLIEIKPCSYPVAFNKVYWIRQGTSTYRHDFDAYNKIVSARKKSSPLADMETSKSAVAPVQQIVRVAETQPYAPAPETPAAPAARTAAPVDADTILAGERVDTGTLRPNSREEWDDGFIPPAFYINFLENGLYDITEDINWQTENYLAVHDDELEKNVVLVYADGAVLTVPMSDFANKDRDNNYSRYKEQPLMFASVGSDDDALFISFSAFNKQVARVERIGDLRKGSMTDTPALLCTGDYDRVLRCEVVPAEQALKLKPLRDVSKSKAGNGLSAVVARQLASIGITL